MNMRSSQLLFCLFAFGSSLFGQQRDTVLLENFQFNPFITMQTVPSGTDTVWVNYDQDGLPSILNTPETKRWTWDQFFVGATDPLTGEVNYSAISYSYLQNSLPGNKNWLITPPVHISEAGYTLSWKSAPSQLPRYMDGYIVLVSTTTNTPAAFTDTIFRAASMTGITGNSQSTNFSNFTFSEGYIHANSCTLPDYFVAGTTIHYGKLEPHEVDLSGFTGQTVYIAFLHNSDDDDRLALDDIIVSRNLSSSVTYTEAGQPSVSVLQNPVGDWLRTRIESGENNDTALFYIFNTSGKRLSEHTVTLTPGVSLAELPVGHLPSGCYMLSCVLNNKVVTLPFIKE
jgi:hypothetical protein